MGKDLTDAGFWDSKWSEGGGGRLKNLINPNWETTEFLARELDSVAVGGKVLELGGAPGTMISQQHGVRPDLEFHCLDFSESGLEKAAALYRREGIRGELHNADIRDWPDGESQFDAVTSFGLVEHFDDFEVIIEQHFTYCRSGGKVIVTVPNYSGSIVRWFLERFSKETLATHNLDCMSQDVLARCGGDSAEEVRTGSYGLAKLPHSNFDPGFGGRSYHLLCKVWNGSISLVSIASGRLLNVRFWPSQLYFVGTKR